ncbi:MAG: alpha/beta fold hydrolase [Myxococcota bacterium]
MGGVLKYYWDVERGRLDHGLRYCRFGHGAETVVVIPGIDDALHDFRWVPRLWAWYFRPLAAAGYTVVVLSRPRGLGDTACTGELAELYGAVLQERFGPCHVVGISMGGMIAQHLAARRPALVRRLVLAVTAHRLGDEGHTHGSTLSELASAGRWRPFLLRTVRICFTGLHLWFLTGLLWVFGFVLFTRRAAAAKDFTASALACAAHDATELLRRIDVPTLVWGARGDCLFPYSAVSQMASVLPRAQLVAVDGAHAAFLQHRTAFHGSVRAFLSSADSTEAP